MLLALSKPLPRPLPEAGRGEGLVFLPSPLRGGAGGGVLGAHALAAFLALAAPASAADNDAPKVTEIPESIVEKFKLDTTFYKKHLDYKGFSIMSSAKVSDEALLEARYLIDRLLGDREDI